MTDAETQPVTSVYERDRQRNQVRADALWRGWDEMTAEGPMLSSFSSFKAGVEAYELYLAKFDRRKR